MSPTAGDYYLYYGPLYYEEEAAEYLEYDIDYGDEPEDGDSVEQYDSDSEESDSETDVRDTHSVSPDSVRQSTSGLIPPIRSSLSSEFPVHFSVSGRVLRPKSLRCPNRAITTERTSRTATEFCSTNAKPG